jgi:kojibiose phosphorylase
MTNMQPDLFAIDHDHRWLMTIDGWEPKHEPAFEAMLALVNGYLGTRAAVEEGSAASTPATFLNGIFDAATKEVAQAGATPDFQVIAAPTPELVVAPDWSRIRIIADGVPLEIGSGELLAQRRVLDMRRGVLVREWKVRAAGKTTRLRSLRCVSLADRHVVLQVVEVTPEDWSGSLIIEAIIEGAVTNEGNVQHLVNHQTSEFDGGMALTTATAEKKIMIAYATSSTVHIGKDHDVPVKNVSTDQTLVARYTSPVEPGQTATLHKICTIFTSRDDNDPIARAQERLVQAANVGIAGLLQQSADAWATRWAGADVGIAENEAAQRRVRFALYHLIGCANPEDEYASAGARSLTGERYKGHVFWDTEIFVFPFFVYTHPPTARALLMYRYHTLPAARAKARQHGYQGALYAWESTDTGVDATPPFVYNAAGERLEILTGVQEHHISADIAYAIWQYWHATHDEPFLLGAGAEMMLELARFWASRARQDEDGAYHIDTVIGPDEFHEYVNDSAYTNCLAQWVLRRGQEVVDWLKQNHAGLWLDLSAKIGFDEYELADWRSVADSLVDNFDPQTRLFEQHRGYFQLEDVDLKQYEPRHKTMDVLLGWSKLQKTQIIKQADVLMLLFLLGDQYPRAVHEANFRYYEPRTSHDSSLSPSFHALAAARLNDLELAERYFEKASNLDLDFSQGVTAAGGVHLAALGGIWQALVSGFGGMLIEENGPRFAPHVPQSWGSLHFSVIWRGKQLAIEVRGEDVIRVTDGSELAEPRVGQ